jgi:hypothetical protein
VIFKEFVLTSDEGRKGPAKSESTMFAADRSVRRGIDGDEATAFRTGENARETFDNECAHWDGLTFVLQWQGKTPLNGWAFKGAFCGFSAFGASLAAWRQAGPGEGGIGIDDDGAVSNCGVTTATPAALSGTVARKLGWLLRQRSRA